MVDVLQIILDFFRVGDLASAYSTPLDQFLYVIFFPTVLLILFIYVLMGRVFPDHRGLSILLGISFYIFIVVYPPEADISLYAAFAPLGTFWYLFVILLGFIYFIFSRILPGEGGGGGGGRGLSRKQSLLSSALGLAIGQRINDKLEWARYRDAYQRELTVIRSQIQEQKALRSSATSDDEKKVFAERQSALESRKKELEEALDKRIYIGPPRRGLQDV